MAELNSPGSAYPGQFGPDAILTSSGVPVTSTPVTVYDSDGTTLASLYATPAVNTPPSYTSAGANPVSTDAYGNLLFYAAPGQYVLSFIVGGVATTKVVIVNPWYSDSTWNGLIVTGAYTTVSGNSVLANASSAAFTVTLPSPTLGSHAQIVKTDTSANAVSVTTPTGVIQGPDLTANATQTLSGPGAFFELFADGTNWNITAQSGGGGGAIAHGIEVAISAVNTWQTIATHTPTATGLYTVQALFDVASGTPTGGVQVTYANANGAVTMSITPTGTSLPVDPNSSLGSLICAHAGTAINVQVQASVTTGLTASATIGAAS